MGEAPTRNFILNPEVHWTFDADCNGWSLGKKTGTSGGRRLSAPRRVGHFRTIPALTSSALLAKRQREIPAKRERLVEIQKSRKPHNFV
jgi:hypothetical protein